MKYHKAEKYTAWNFAVDCFMIWLTKGLWLIWILIRELMQKCMGFLFRTERIDIYA